MGKVTEHFIGLLGEEEANRRANINVSSQAKFDKAISDLSGPKKVGQDLIYRFKKSIEEALERLDGLDDLETYAKHSDDFGKHEETLMKLDDLVAEMSICIDSATVAVHDARENWENSQQAEEFQGYNSPKDFL